MVFVHRVFAAIGVSLCLVGHVGAHPHHQQISHAGAPRLSKPVITSAPASSSPEDFKTALALVLNRMMSSYQLVVKEPIRIDVLDTSVPSIGRFLEGVNGVHDPHTVLAVSFDGRARINGKPTASCMVNYNSDQRHNLLSGYERSGLFNRASIVYYLAAHEFAHCMAFHQEALGKQRPLGPKEHELLADQVAVAFFLVNGQSDVASNVVEFNRRLIQSELHTHPKELKAFHDDLKATIATQDVRQSYRSMFDLYKIAVANVNGKR